MVITPFDWQIALLLGMLLVIALVAGGLAAYLRLPKVTPYLSAGILLGMSGGGKGGDSMCGGLFACELRVFA